MAWVSMASPWSYVSRGSTHGDNTPRGDAELATASAAWGGDVGTLAPELSRFLPRFTMPTKDFRFFASVFLKEHEEANPGDVNPTI